MIVKAQTSGGREGELGGGPAAVCVDENKDHNDMQAMPAGLGGQYLASMCVTEFLLQRY